MRTVLGLANVTDDDGVCVVASSIALRSRWSAGRTFDYDFPRALLEGIHAGELVAWFSGAEGEHRVTIVANGPNATEGDTTRSLTLRVGERA